MSFRPGLTTVSTTAPAPWVMLAHAILISATSTGQQAVTNWRQWAGGGHQDWVDNSDVPFLSNWSVVIADNIAIVAYEGTKDTPQLLAQVGGAVQIPGQGFAGNVNAAQEFMLLQQRAQLVTILQNNLTANAQVILVGHSLGGALAAMAASSLRALGYVVSLATYGQPRVGDPTFNGGVGAPWLRVINGNDLVTTIPPTVGTLNVLVGALTNGIASFNYVHGGTPWVIGFDETNVPLLVRGAGISNASSPAASIATYINSVAFSNVLASVHPLFNYINVLSALAALDLPNNIQYQGLLLQYNNLYGVRSRTPAPQPALNPIPNGNLLPDPNVIVAPPPAVITVPPADRNQQVEARIVSITPNPPQSNTPILRVGVPAVAVGTYQKCTFLFSQLNQGWSETYYLLAATPQAALIQASTVNPGQTKINTLASAMMGLRGPQCSLNAVRVSQSTLPVVVPKPRISQLSRFTPAKMGSFAGVINEADIFNTCIVLQMTGGAGVPPKLTHMRGIPDAFVVAGGEPAGTMAAFFGAAWTGPATGLQTVLQGDGWGWFGQGTLRKVPLTNLVQDAAGTVTITVTNAALLAGLVVGGVYPFRVAGVTKPKAINGVWPFVVNAGLLSITTRKLFGILEWDGGAQGTVTYNPQSFNQIGNALYNNIGERKAGRPSDLQRGRQPVRQRG